MLTVAPNAAAHVLRIHRQRAHLGQVGPDNRQRRAPDDLAFQRQMIDATHIDRLNLGPIPTTQLNWLQPHEGNIVDFLFRARAFQYDKDKIHV